MKRNTLGRSEHLKSEKAINQLFEAGYSLSLNPIRLVFQLTSADELQSVKVGFVVPKKKFKRAVDRNLLKRRMREAYRLNKRELTGDTSENIPGVNIMFVYQGQQIEEYIKISDCVRDLLRRLAKKIHKKIGIND